MSKMGREFLRKQEEDFICGKLIPKKDAILYIDVFCYSCKRRVAMSNTIEIDGRRYCYRCKEGRR